MLVRDPIIVAHTAVGTSPAQAMDLWTRFLHIASADKHVMLQA